MLQVGLQLLNSTGGVKVCLKNSLLAGPFIEAGIAAILGYLSVYAGVQAGLPWAHGAHRIASNCMKALNGLLAVQQLQQPPGTPLAGNKVRRTTRQATALWVALLASHGVVGTASWLAAGWRPACLHSHLGRRLSVPVWLEGLEEQRPLGLRHAVLAPRAAAASPLFIHDTAAIDCRVVWLLLAKLPQPSQRSAKRTSGEGQTELTDQPGLAVDLVAAKPTQTADELLFEEDGIKVLLAVLASSPSLAEALAHYHEPLPEAGQTNRCEGSPVNSTQNANMLVVHASTQTLS